MWIIFNPNPEKRQVGDCAIRAVVAATGKAWSEAYSEIALQGLVMCDMPSSNAVWGAYLKRQGFQKHTLPDSCPECYTVSDFCTDHPTGICVVAVSNHVVTVKDGNFYDTWDSGNEIPLYYFEKEG